MGWMLGGLPNRPRLAETIAWTLGVSSTMAVGFIHPDAAKPPNVVEKTHGTIFELRGDGGHHVALLFALLIWATSDCRLAGDTRHGRASSREQTRTRSHRTTGACRLRDGMDALHELRERRQLRHHLLSTSSLASSSWLPGPG